MPIQNIQYKTNPTIKDLPKEDPIETKQTSRIRKIVNIIIGHISEFFAVIAMIGVYFFPLRRFDPKEGDVKNNEPPILLVHGLLHNSSAWIALRYRLKQKKFSNVFTVDLGAIPIKSIKEYAEVLQKRIGEISILTGRSDIKLIGHSMGGVVSAYYALHLAKDDKVSVTDVITLNSPLRGTKMHIFAPGPCVQDMGYHTKFIQDLSKKIKNATTTRFFHVASRADIVVRPYYSALNIDENPENLDPAQYYIAPNLGHAGVLYSKQISDLLIKYLTDNTSFIPEE